MTLDWRDFEVLTFAQAVAELSIPTAIANEFAIAIAGVYGDLRSDQQPRTRREWALCLGAVPVAIAYSKFNACSRDPESLHFRAMQVFDFVFAVREARDTRKAIKRPAEFLSSLCRELHRRMNNPRQRILGVPFRVIYEHSKVPEIGAALLKRTRGGPPTAQQWLDAINDAQDSRSRKGRRSSMQEREVYRLLRDDFEWLTGRKPAWTNATGTPDGEFVRFVRAVYGAVGIHGLSERMLRPERRSRRV